MTRTSIAIGDEFRDQVARLLKSAGMDVETEVLVTHKKVDVLAKQVNLGISRTYAIECKNYRRSAGKEEIALVWAEHSALLNSNEVDEVWLILSRDCSAAAKAYARNQPRFRVLTFETLQNTIIDFSKYIRAILNDEATLKLSAYYVRPKSKKGVDLLSYIHEWAQNDDNRPIAVLGGYGKGKTSLARRLADDLAKLHQKDGSKRIPILVPLSEISSEQSLEGLLGKHFTTFSSVHGYTYGVFEELNKGGRFVIIFDGFDEMKHAITWEQFRYNFQQINRLAVGRAKVMVLGRPTAFVSEEEFDWILKGKRRQGIHELRIPGTPSYRTMEIGDLDLADSYKLIENYILSLAAESHSAPSRQERVKFVEERMKTIRKLNYDNLITRPVHAKMLADLAADPKVRLREFSKFDLYDLFINQTIERETTKTARRTFKDTQRRHFARELAWWLWKRASSPNITLEMIPDVIFRLFSRNSDDDFEAIRRDLISSCFLEKKNQNVLYFPHRSFQEFLVAEHFLLDGLGTSEIQHASALMNEEILEFIESSGNRALTRRWSASIEEYTGPLDLRFLRAFSIGWNFRRRTEEGGKFAESIFAAGIIAEYLSVENTELSGNEIDEYIRILVTTIREATTQYTACAALMVLQFLQARKEANIQKIASLALVETVLEKMDWKRFIGPLSSPNKQYSIYNPNIGHWMCALFVQHFRAIELLDREKRQRTSLTISIDGLNLQENMTKILAKHLSVIGIERVKITPVIRIENEDLVAYLRQRNAVLAGSWMRFIELGGNPGDILMPRVQ